MTNEAEQWKAKGNAALSAKKHAEAVDCYTKAIEIDSSNHVFFSNRSAAYLSDDKAQLALDDAESCIKLKSSWGKGYARKGAALHALRDYEGAVAAYEEGLAAEPNNAACANGVDEVKKAMSSSNTFNPLAGAFGPDMFAKLAMNPRVRHLLDDPAFVTKLQEVQKNPSKLNEYLQDQRMMTVLGELLGIGGMTGGGPNSDMNDTDNSSAPDSTPAPTSSSSSANTIKSTPPPASASVVELTEEEQKEYELKQSAETAKNKGNQFYKQKQFEQAIECYNEATEKDGTNMSYLSNLAAVHLEMKDFDTCIETCKKAIAVGRENRADYALVAKAFVRIGNAYLKKDEASIECLEKSMEAYENAQVENRTQDVDRKIKTLKLKLKKAKELAYLDPEKAVVAKNEGNEYFKQGDFPNAVKLYSEAIKRDPTSAVYYANRAAAYTKLTSFVEAKNDCEKALEIDPKYVKAYSRQGAIQFFMKEYHKALESYQKGLEIDPTNQECKDGLRQVTMKIQSGETDSERAAHGLADPEIQIILRDPIMQNVLNDFQTDPRGAQRHLQNAGILAKIEKLIAAGVLQTK